MFKKIFLIFIFLLITSCNHNKVLVKETEIKSFNYVYIEKPFKIKWTIQKKSITSIPTEIKKRIKIICKEFNRIVLIKIKTFQDNTAVGTFECRI